MAGTRGDKGNIPQSGRGEKPTLRTIAESAGLAVTTVSRALSGDPRIAAKTRERVAAIADAVGYVPDRAAQRLRTGRTNVISFILEPHDEMLAFGSMMIAGITEAIRGTPYHLVVTPQFADADPVAPVRHILRNRLADGIIFCRTQPFDLRVRLLLEADFPFVTHGRTELATPHPYVDFDNSAFARDAVLRLAARGHGKIGLIGAPDTYTFSQHLRHGFMAGIRETGAQAVDLDGISINSAPEDIRRRVFDRVSAGAADAFVCGGESPAMSVVAAVSDAGLAINRDIGLVAKQTTPLFGQILPPVETIYEDLTAAGRDLAEILMKRIAGEPAEGLQRLQSGERLFDARAPRGAPIESAVD